MSIRRYLSQLVGTGTTGDPYRPAVADLIPASRPWIACDGRTDATLPTGTMMVEADVTDTQHAAVIADPRVTVLTIEDAAGQPIADDALLTAVPLAKRNAVKNLLIANHIPVADFTATTTVGEVMKRLRRRFLIRQYLRDADYDEIFATVISTLPVAKRQAIAARLQAAGYDISPILLTDTVEEALRKLLGQEHG